MWWKALGVFLVLLVVGAASGYALGDHSTDQPGTIPSIGPVVAVSPSYPAPPSVSVAPDDDDPALLTGVPLTPEQLIGARNGFPLTSGRPTGWIENRMGSRFTWVDPDAPSAPYVLRVDLIADQHEATDVAVEGRISQLRSAAANGALLGLDIVAHTDDYLVASYVIASTHQLQWTYQRWVMLGSNSAYADVAATGRVVDKAGLSDLVNRVAASMLAQPLAPTSSDSASTFSDQQSSPSVSSTPTG